MKNFLKTYRWRIVAILFFATVVNYIDRNVFGFIIINDAFRKEMLGLAPDAILTDASIKLFKEKMGHVDAIFKLAYGLGFVLFGWLIDKLGTKKGFSLSIVIWSIAGMLTGFVSNIRGLMVGRFLLGIGEAGLFPSAVKSVAEWFRQKDRSHATGIFNAGANIGIIITAMIVPYIVSQWGWRYAFIITGSFGILLLLLWLGNYYLPSQHPALSAEEKEYLQEEEVRDVEVKEVTWLQVIPNRATWAFALSKFLVDGVWWFYLTWLPDFFNSNTTFTTKLDLKSITWPFIIIYLVSDGGSIFYGWLATQFMKRGWSVNKARKITMLVCACSVVPIFLAATTSSVMVAVLLLCIATAAHQGFMANLFTIVSDSFPKQSVASVTGIGGLMGAIGGALLSYNAGKIIAQTGYLPLFLFAATAYLIALLLIHVLIPVIKTGKN
jgi:MFS transporter, ACS family, hexuronate transporter